GGRRPHHQHRRAGVLRRRVGHRRDRGRRGRARRGGRLRERRHPHHRPHHAGHRVRLLRGDRRLGAEPVRRGRLRLGGRDRAVSPGGARRKLLPALLGGAAAVVAAVAIAQTASTFTLKRDDTELVISNRALAADGARTIGNNRNCEEGQRLTIVYGPAPGHVETRVEDALLTSSLAVIRAPVAAQEGEGEETLELSDASVTFNRPGCIEAAEPVATPRVTLVQGRTEVRGTRFFLDRGEDEGVMDGPIALE